MGGKFMKRKILSLIMSIIFTISSMQSFNPLVKSEPISVTLGAIGAVAAPVCLLAGTAIGAYYRYKQVKIRAQLAKERGIQPVPSGNVTHVDTNYPELLKSINGMAIRKSAIWAKRGFPLKPLLEDQRIIGKELLQAPENAGVVKALYDLIEYIKGEIRVRARNIAEARRFVQYFAHIDKRASGQPPQESTGLDADNDIFGATFRLILDDGTTRYITIAFAPEHDFNMPERNPLHQRSKQELLEKILEDKTTKQNIKEDLVEIFGSERSRTRSDVQNLETNLYSLIGDLIDGERFKRVRVARWYERFVDPQRLLKLAKRCIIGLPSISYPLVLAPREGDDSSGELEDSSPEIPLADARWHRSDSLSRSASVPFTSSAQLSIPTQISNPEPAPPTAPELVPAPPTILGETTAEASTDDSQTEEARIEHMRLSQLAWLVDQPSDDDRFIDLRLLRRMLSIDPNTRQKKQRAGLVQYFAVNVIGDLDMVIAIKNGRNDIDERTGFPHYLDQITPADSYVPFIPITLDRAAQLTVDLRRLQGILTRMEGESSATLMDLATDSTAAEPIEHVSQAPVATKQSPLAMTSFPELLVMMARSAYQHEISRVTLPDATDGPILSKRPALPSSLLSRSQLLTPKHSLPPPKLAPSSSRPGGLGVNPQAVSKAQSSGDSTETWPRTGPEGARKPKATAPVPQLFKRPPLRTHPRTLKSQLPATSAHLRAKPHRPTLLRTSKTTLKSASDPSTTVESDSES